MRVGGDEVTAGGRGTLDKYNYKYLFGRMGVGGWYCHCGWLQLYWCDSHVEFSVVVAVAHLKHSLLPRREISGEKVSLSVSLIPS